MITSEALRFENARNPNPERQQFAGGVLALAGEDVPHSADLEKMAQVWQNVGIGLLDALHLDSAELAGAARFATCDDLLLNKAVRVASKMQIVAIVDLFKELIP